MNEHEASRYWEENAEAWTTLSRAGYDRYRDGFNTPVFLENLPGIQGLSGLDIGCGEGHNTRLLAALGARMTGVDISETFIHAAEEAETGTNTYQVASATALPFPDNSFDFATSFMCLMDIPEPQKALTEAFRVIRPGGFFQFSISHPCFATPHRKNLRGPDGKTYAIEVGGYFESGFTGVEEWIFGAAPAALKARYAPFRIPVYHYTLSEWTDFLLSAGFGLEKLWEPRPDAKAIARFPSIQDAGVVGYFLGMRGRKAGK